MKHILLGIILCFGVQSVFAQKELLDYSSTKEYEIGAITVSGNDYSDEKAIISVSGLKVGEKVQIPGTDISSAIKALYKLKLYSQVEILLNKTVGDVAILEIQVVEKPRFSRHSIKGVKKSSHEELNDIINAYVYKNSIVTEDLKQNIIHSLLSYYHDKGYLDASVDILEFKEEAKNNSVRLLIDINKRDRVKINNISFEGNEEYSDKKLRKKMKNTKRFWQVFTKSKYQEKEFNEDKKSILAHYQKQGYRDAEIVSDSTYRTKRGNLNVVMNINEGKRYYFRNIAIKGASLHTPERIKEIIGIQRGDIYNSELLTSRLSFSQDGRDVSSLYMDDGYLFFRADPVETAIEQDSVDIEVRIFEGPQATIDKVVIKGNDRTHEHVIRRELRTQPGDKFSRSAIIRSQRQILALGYFNQEALGINTPVNSKRGTVDIEYTLEEKPSDQLELSAGYSQFGLIATLGVVFNNFSTRNIFKKSAWSPLPQGDGQKLSLRVQTNGKFYQTYNFSFTEPWLGGKKPQSFTVGALYSKLVDQFNSSNYFSDLRFYVGLGSRLQWPDDNFLSNTQLTFDKIRLNNYSGFLFEGETVNQGDFYNISVKQTIARTTISDPLFPRSGSKLSLTGQFTFPYSLVNNVDYSNKSLTDRFKFVEYHKWRFDSEWYYNLVNKLVFAFNAKMGYIGYYNDKVGVPPFERFALGGDGVTNSGYTITGRDIFSLRGYELNEVKAQNEIEWYQGNVNDKGDGTIFNKFTVELRYPVSLNPSSTIYASLFATGGNMWYGFKDYNPFELKRSVGLGVRVFMPYFGLLGFDYAVGFDKPWQFTNKFNLKDYAKFSFILGFEPE